MLTKFLDPKNDVAFKRIFGTEKNKNILIHFLNDMLGFSCEEKIRHISFLKTAQDPDIASKKQSIVDVLCTDEKGAQYIVEMQVARTGGFEKRAQYYAAKAYVSQMNSGEAYAKLKEIIFLAITDFVMFPDKEEYKSDHLILDKKTCTQDLKDFYFCFLELPKFHKSIDELQTIVEKWTYFFKHASHTKEADVEKITGSDEVIGQAYQVLNQFSWSDEELSTYEQEKKRELDAKAILLQQRIEGKAEGLAEGIEKGKAEGLAEGIEKGQKNALLAVAKQMLSQGLKPGIVRQYTNLSEEEIDSVHTESSEI